MDQQKLRTLVFEKTGVRIDVDDPVFALVALNEAVLAEAVERHVALLDEATRALAEQAQALRDGGAIGRHQPAPGGRGTPAPGANRSSLSERRMIGIAAGAAVLGALLVLCGQALLLPPSKLSAAQQGAIDNGEKLARIVRQLDPQTRDAIQAEMQKP